MPFFGVPFDAQDVVIRIFGAVGQLVGQAMGGGGERFNCFFVGVLEGAAPLFVDLVARVFHNHDGSWVRYWGIGARSLLRAGSWPCAMIARLRYPSLMQLRSCTFYLTRASGRVQ